MALECFVPKNFRDTSLVVIQQANAIIDEYQRQGFTLTLRQLYYQFVARDLIPNKQTEYDRLGSIINDARLAGLIDWDAIEDRTRFLRSYTTHHDPAAALRAVSRRYIEDLWDSQTTRMEVWIEKDALIGVIEPVCGRWRIPYFACRGYTSQSELYSAGKRLADYIDRGQNVVVLHLGDHDPSGIDMTRDNRERVHMFAAGELFMDDEPDERYLENIEFRRMALNMDQIRRYRPPPNPAKESDSRHGQYVEQFNTRSSWELDALDPSVIDQIIETEVQAEVDIDQWNEATQAESRNCVLLDLAADRWDDIEKMLETPRGG